MLMRAALGDHVERVVDLPMHRLRRRNLRRRPAEQIALRKIHIRFHRENQLLGGLHAFDHHQHPRLMQQRHELRQNRLLGAVRGRANQLAVELDEVRADSQQAVEVRLPGAEIVDGDQEAVLAVQRRRPRHIVDAAAMRFENLENHPLGFESRPPARAWRADRRNLRR